MAVLSTMSLFQVLQRIYLTMRAQASLGTSIPVTTRHLESLIRLSQARARMELREEVSLYHTETKERVHSILDIYRRMTPIRDYA
jgi:DNA helicase MCM8